MQVRIAREFVPPGEVIWLERYKVTRPRLRTPLAPPAAATATEITSVAATNKADLQSSSLDKAQAAHQVDIEIARVPLPAKSTSTQGTAAEATQNYKHTWFSRSNGQLKKFSHTNKSLSSVGTASSVGMSRVGSAALAAAALVGNVTVTRLRPHVTDGLSLIVGGMVVSRNMFLDHVPDQQYAQLKRLVRWMKRQ